MRQPFKRLITILAVLLTAGLTSCAVVPLPGHGAISINPFFPFVLHGGHSANHGGYDRGGRSHRRGRGHRRGH